MATRESILSNFLSIAGGAHHGLERVGHDFEANRRERLLQIDTQPIGVLAHLGMLFTDPDQLAVRLSAFERENNPTPLDDMLGTDGFEFDIPQELPPDPEYRD